MGEICGSCGIIGKIVAVGLKYIDDAVCYVSRMRLGEFEVLFKTGNMPLSIFTLFGFKVEEFLVLP